MMSYHATEPAVSIESLGKPHALQPCWDMQLAGLSADALQLALQHGVFTQLDQWLSAAELALRLGFDATNTDYFLELLSGLGLVECQGGTVRLYRNTSDSRRYLNAASPLYCGDALLFRHTILRRVGTQLEGLLTTGVVDVPEPERVQKGWAEAARLQIAQEQLAVTTEVACELVAGLPEYEKAQRLLDLGGGPGLVAIALAQQQPELQAVVFEYPEAAEVAQQRIVAAGLERRVHTMAGDLLTDEFGADYDIIWCSSVLHFVPDIEAVLQRLYQALRSGGVLVCCHAEVPAEAHKATAVLHYYLHMRMQGRQVWPEGQLAQKLQQVGFTQIQQYDAVRFPVAPVAAVIARKE